MAKSLSARQAKLQLVALFERNGCVRLQNPDRLSEGPRAYKKGTEVRLIADSEAEVTYIQELLDVRGFSSGRPFAKGDRFCIPIYGFEQVSSFMAMVDEHAV